MTTTQTPPSIWDEEHMDCHECSRCNRRNMTHIRRRGGYGHFGYCPFCAQWVSLQPFKAEENLRKKLKSANGAGGDNAQTNL